MTTVYDVPASELINKVAQELKNNKNITPPKWGLWVKTGIHKELPPKDSNWWYVRCASILRRIYIDGPVGISRLRTYYGGKERRGVIAPKFSRGSGSIIREALQQLEKAGYVLNLKKGRAISPKGQSFLDNTAHDLKKELIEKIPDLAKY
ncbi:MAG TPA: 30S ribosomal protein S19e [Methanosarcinales archaeon]|nr:30S ribosomal protein S19e [Methanosarcinales archaeon]